WENEPRWQPIRKAVELALVEYDWDRAFVVTNLVVKPVTDLLLLDQLSHQLAAVGAPLDALALENLMRDSRRSRRWTSALVAFLTAQDGNHEVLQGYLEEFAPLGDAAIKEGGALIATPVVDRSAQDISAQVREQWTRFLGDAGLKVGVA